MIQPNSGDLRVGRFPSFHRLAVGGIMLFALAGGGGCATNESVESLRREVQASTETLKKDLRADIETAKKQSQEQSQTIFQKAQADLEALKKEYGKTMIEAQAREEALAKEIKELKEQQALMAQDLKVKEDLLAKHTDAQKKTQAALLDLRKQAEALLKEFQDVRAAVRMTYGGALEFLRVEEALLKASLQRIQTIMNGSQISDEASSPPMKKD